MNFDFLLGYGVALYGIGIERDFFANSGLGCSVAYAYDKCCWTFGDMTIYLRSKGGGILL